MVRSPSSFSVPSTLLRWARQDADHSPAGVEGRSAAVARICRSVDLQILDAELSSVSVAHDALADARFEAPRAADQNHAVASGDQGGVAERHRLCPRAGHVDQRHVEPLVFFDQRGGERLAVGEGRLHLRALGADNVRVGQRMFGVDEKRRAEGRLAIDRDH